MTIIFLSQGIIMLSRKAALQEIFNKHGQEAVYIAPTGFLSRAVYQLYPTWGNIFYMQGSMGLSPGIGIGIALNTDKEVVVLNGDGGHLMHLGLTHTVRDLKLDNLFVYILDNGVHESVGSQECSVLEKEYPGVNKIYKISCDGKCPRVAIGFEDNANTIANFVRDLE